MKRLQSILLLFILSSTFVLAQKERVVTSKKLYLDFSSYYNSQKSPVIIWENPGQDNKVTADRRFKLKLTVSANNEIDEVNIYVNNFINSTQRGFKIVKADDSTSYQKTIDTDLILLPGENEVRVTASDVRGNSSSSIKKITVDMQEIDQELSSRKDYALLIGTNNYAEWDDLVNPVFDVETIADELRNTYGFEVETLIDPSKRELLQTIRKYSKMNFLPNDQLLVFVAGHGHFDQYFNQGYLVCNDSKKEDEEKMSYISHSNFRDIVNYIPCRHIFLTIDACFGGTFDPKVASSGVRGGGDFMYDELTQSEYIKRKLRFKTRKFLTSGGKEYVPDGRPGSHSPFVRKFLEALRYRGGQDGILTLDELKSYVEKITPEPRYGEFGANEPGSDFLFIVNEEL